MSKNDMANSGEQLKAEIAGHPLCEQLVAAHVACLRVATPIDEAQLSQSHHLLRSYAQSATHSLSKRQTQELDTLLRQYVLVLWSLREKLHQHVRVEAAIRCREIEHNFISLTGARVGEGSGARMWDDEEEVGMGSVREREVERVRKELKIELKEGFKSRIEQVRDEILRKTRSGKLPDDTTHILNNWWHHHSNWPYPTEDDKANLVERTGLELKQINNWFINQRKRKWQNPNSSAPRTKKNI